MQTVLNPHPTELEVIYDTLLVPSFRDEQMESLEEILAGVRAKTIYVIALKDEKHGYVAVTVNYWYAKDQTLLLAYLAVSPKMRGKGLGTSLVFDSKAYLEIELKPALILCEANDPDFDTVSENYGDPVRRLSFYKDMGARIVDVPYFQASYDYPVAMVNMYLLVLPGKYMETSTAFNENREIRSRTIHDFFLSYMETDTEPDEDPEFTALFNSLKRPWIPTREIKA